MGKLHTLLLFVILFAACSDNSTGNDDNNHAPVITDLVSNPDTIGTGEISTLTCSANDADGDELTFVWESDSGSINGSGNSVNWLAPNTVGNYIVRCKVLDGKGGQDIDSVNIVVEQKTPTAGLVAYYPFDGNANDESGNGNDGTVIGAVLAPDRFGNANNAYSFDGNNDYILIPHVSSLDLFASLTIDTWAFRTSSAVPQHLVGKRSGCSSGSNFYQLAIGGGAFSSASVPLNQWVHLAITIDGNIQTLYVNGQVVTVYNHTPLSSNNADLKIGGSGTCAAFSGLLDEVDIFNRVLSAEEIQALYNRE